MWLLRKAADVASHHLRGSKPSRYFPAGGISTARPVIDFLLHGFVASRIRLNKSLICEPNKPPIRLIGLAAG
jgi:hypothetical protein